MTSSTTNRRGVVVVSGGTAGAGRAIVREFASAGYDVAVLGRGRAGLDAAAAEVREKGQAALAIKVDVSDAQAVMDAADRVEREIGPIDVWVNVAFVGALRYFWHTDPDLYRRITEVTYLGQVHGTMAALAKMRERDAGSIVQVGSALAYRGIPLQAAYCGAKHAIVGFTESVIAELKHERSRIHVGMVQLPGMNTPQFDWNDNEFDQPPMPVAPIFQPELAGRAVRYVAEHRRRNMWVGVSTAYTILGNRFAPRVLDWYLARSGVSGQLSDQPATRRGANAYEPQDEVRDAGAHGRFDDRAHARDPWSAASMHPVAAASLAAVPLVLSCAATGLRRRGRRRS
ncbi:MAG TPA: SDR family oxidoreductase [Mycobacteriales bacterium]|nr:SDR family oxidoreductase [Mycobacteriales bacterium]